MLIDSLLSEGHLWPNAATEYSPRWDRGLDAPISRLLAAVMLAAVYTHIVWTAFITRQITIRFKTELRATYRDAYCYRDRRYKSICAGLLVGPLAGPPIRRRRPDLSRCSPHHLAVES